MYKIRQISYAKNSISIEVYKIENRKRVIVKHIGTAKTDAERDDMLSLAKDFIKPKLCNRKSMTSQNLFKIKHFIAFLNLTIAMLC